MSKRTMVSEKGPIKSRAQKYLPKGNYKKALEEFQKITKLEPMDLRARLRVGDLLQKLGRTGEAVAQYKQLTRHYAKEGFLIQAISLNKIILRIDPSQEGINKELADLYAQTGVSSQMVAKGQRVEKEFPEIPLFSERISIMRWEHIPPLRELWRPFRGRDWKSQGTSSPPPGPRRQRQQWFNVRTPS